MAIMRRLEVDGTRPVIRPDAGGAPVPYQEEEDLHYHPHHETPSPISPLPPPAATHQRLRQRGEGGDGTGVEVASTGLSLGVMASIVTVGTLVVGVGVAFLCLWLSRRRARRNGFNASVVMTEDDDTTIMALGEPNKLRKGERGSVGAFGGGGGGWGRLRRAKRGSAGVGGGYRRKGSLSLSSSVPQLPPLFIKRSSSHSLNPFTTSPRRRTVSTWLDEDALHGPTMAVAKHKDKHSRRRSSTSARDTWPMRAPTLPKVQVTYHGGGGRRGSISSNARVLGQPDEAIRDEQLHHREHHQPQQPNRQQSPQHKSIRNGYHQEHQRQRPQSYTVAAALQGNLVGMPAMPAWQLPKPPRPASLPPMVMTGGGARGQRPLPDPNMYVSVVMWQQQQQQLHQQVLLQQQQWRAKQHQHQQVAAANKQNNTFTSPPKKGMLMRPPQQQPQQQQYHYQTHKARQASTDSTLSEILRSTEQRLQEGGATGVARRNRFTGPPGAADATGSPTAGKGHRRTNSVDGGAAAGRWANNRHTYHAPLTTQQLQQQSRMSCQIPSLAMSVGASASAPATAAPTATASQGFARQTSQSSVVSEPESVFSDGVPCPVEVIEPGSAAPSPVRSNSGGQRRQQHLSAEQPQQQQQQRALMRSPTPSSDSSELSTVYSEDEGRDAMTAVTAATSTAVSGGGSSSDGYRGKLDLQKLVAANGMGRLAAPRPEDDPFVSDSPVKGGGGSQWTPRGPRGNGNDNNDMSLSSRLRHGMFSRPSSPGKSQDRAAAASSARSRASTLETPTRPPGSTRTSKFRSPASDVLFTAHDPKQARLLLEKASQPMMMTSAPAGAAPTARGEEGNDDDDIEGRPAPLFFKNRSSVQSKRSTTSAGGLSSVYDFYIDRDAPPTVPSSIKRGGERRHHQHGSPTRAPSLSSSIYSDDDEAAADVPPEGAAAAGLRRKESSRSGSHKKKSPTRVPPSAREPGSSRSSSPRRKGSRRGGAGGGSKKKKKQHNTRDVLVVVGDEEKAHYGDGDGDGDGGNYGENIESGKPGGKGNNWLRVTSTIAELRRMNSTVSGYSQASSTGAGSPTLPALRGGGFSPQAKNGGSKHYLAVGSSNRSGSSPRHAKSTASAYTSASSKDGNKGDSEDEAGAKAGVTKETGKAGRSRARAGTVAVPKKMYGSVIDEPVLLEKENSIGPNDENKYGYDDDVNAAGDTVGEEMDQNALAAAAHRVYMNAVHAAGTRTKPSSSASASSPSRMGIPRTGVIMTTPPTKNMLSRLAQQHSGRKVGGGGNIGAEDSPGLYDKDGFLIATPPTTAARGLPRTGTRHRGSRT